MGLNFNKNYFPERIICLTEETTETLYLLGEEKRIVGISGFTVRPARARKEKPKVSTFIDAKIDEIVALKPDLVIGFSDIQANIAKHLIENGITVWVNNYRSVDGIFEMIAQLGSLVGQQDKAICIIDDFKDNLQKINVLGNGFTVKPKIYFEEWYEPLISGIRWVSELIELAGGQDVFPEFQETSLAKDRIIADSMEVVRRNPDIIIASWCGKKFKRDKLITRPSWENINAVRDNQIFEINSSIILQPGPAALTDGLQQISNIILQWQQFKQNK